MAIPNTAIDPLSIFSLATGGEVQSVAAIFQSEPTGTGNPFAVNSSLTYPIAWHGETFNLKIDKAQTKFERQEPGSIDTVKYTCLIPDDENAVELRTGQYVFAERSTLMIKGILEKCDRKPFGVIRLTIALSQNVPILIEDAMPYLVLP